MLALSLEIEQCDTDRPASKSRFCQKMEIEQNNSQVARCPVHHARSVHLCPANLITRFDDRYAAEFREKFQMEVPLFCKYDLSKKAFVPEISSLRPDV